MRDDAHCDFRGSKGAGIAAPRRLACRVLLLSTFFCLSLSAVPARADCLDPAGVAGDIIFNASERRPQYCNDTDWIGFPGVPVVPVWGLAHTINNPTPVASDLFGGSVALSRNLLVIGAAKADPGGVSNTGIAYVFDVRTGALVSTLNNPDPDVDDFFGADEFHTGSLAIDGNIVVVGAVGDDQPTTGWGAVHVFNAMTGALLYTLETPGPMTGRGFGWSVGISGNLIIVGDLSNNIDAANGGMAWVFNATTGALVTGLSNPDPESNGNFGSGVAISGNLAVVGARRHDVGANPDAGMAYVFNATTGALLQTIDNPAPESGDNFGMRVAIDGGIVAVGAHNDDPLAVGDAGTVYTFDANTGNLLATQENPAPTGFDSLGFGLSISGNFVAAGPRYYGSGNEGRGYVYDATTGALVGTILTPDIAQPFFGQDSAIFGNVVVFSAPYHDPGGVSDAGRVYVFTPPGCANPAGVTGDIVFNSSNRVLQWCDGTEWHAAGPKDPAGPMAGCATPSGIAGGIVYNSTHNIMQYCDGDAWRRIGGVEPLDPCFGVSTPGGLCPDGSVFAGVSLSGGGYRIYTTPADAPPGDYSWNNGGTNYTVTGVGHMSDGETNTNQLLAIADASAPYDPAVYCGGLSAHGHDDWYWPAPDELQLLYNNRVAIGGFTNDYYWASRETAQNTAHRRYFVDGTISASTKNGQFEIRCVRKN